MIAWIITKARTRVGPEVVRQGLQIGVSFYHPLAGAARNLISSSLSSKFLLSSLKVPHYTRTYTNVIFLLHTHILINQSAYGIFFSLSQV